jgi:NAD(P) transhydrogenase
LNVTLTTEASLVVDTILFAAGRVGNTEDLRLEAAGVRQDAKNRILVDANFQASTAGISATGDVIGPTLASNAMEQGRRAACRAFDIPVTDTLDSTTLSAVYSMPEVARAGLTEEEWQERGLDYAVDRAELGQAPRGAIAGRGELLKLIFLKDTRRIVDTHCFGDIASEIVGVGQMAIRCAGTIHTIANMTMNTPTYSYAYKYAALDGLRWLATQGLLAAHPPSLPQSQGRSI